MFKSFRLWSDSDFLPLFTWDWFNSLKTLESGLWESVAFVLCFITSSCWRLLRFTFLSSQSQHELRCFIVGLLCVFFFYYFFWLSLVVCLRGWCRSEQRTREWRAAAETTTCLFQSVRTPPEATTPPSTSSFPCFYSSVALFFLCDLLLCSSSALPVRFPHGLGAKLSGGCHLPGPSVGHPGHRHLLQVYTTNSFMTGSKPAYKHARKLKPR